MPGVSAIVAAAGLSTRFGGPNKLLQPYGEGTIVGSVAAVLRSLSLDVLVVTGRDAELVAAAVAPSPTVFNRAYAEGLGGSIACGVRAAGDSEGYLVALGDMPGIRADVVSRLLDVLDPLVIAAPVYASEPDRLGHPVLFGRAYREELSALAGDHGARSVIEAHRDRLVRVSVDGALVDIDTPGAV